MKRPTIQIASLVETQDDPTVIIDKHYRIIAANRAYCESYGVRPDKIVGRCCHEISHHSPVPCHLNGEQCPHEQVFRSGKPFEVLHTHYDRHNQPDHVRIKAYPLHDSTGATYLMETIHRLAPAVDLTCEEMQMVGRAPAFLACIENLTTAAHSEAPVLIYGETGVGKELAARLVHERSPRRSQAYVELNCAAIPEPLFESELFGHERGAFTGCVGLKRGLFELADGGTLFLDEIGELPLSMQAKLLRVLDSGEFRRVGGQTLRQADVRVIAATNQNLLALAADGRFREDLYFRIAGIKVNLPPLRERRMDIPALAEALVKRLCKRKDRECRITRDAIERLMHYDYPGNIRELRNILQRAVALSSGGVIGANHIHVHEWQQRNTTPPTNGGAPRRNGTAYATDAGISLSQIESRHIGELLGEHGGNRRVVAGILGISERTLYRKLNRYQLR